MLNIDLKLFKKNHKSRKNQVLYHAIKSNGLKEIENLINNFLNVRNSFVFESVEKGFIKGRYTIFGKNPDKIWEFNNNNCFLRYENKRKKLKQIIKNKKLPLDERFKAQLKLAKIPRNSARNRIRNRCEITGRPHGVYRKLKISRIALRELASNGKIPGMTKSSW